MNDKSEYICPICGEGTLRTDFTDGTKWGRAYCTRCDCGGPEVCTGYGENFDSPWRANARKLFVDVVNEHVSKRCEVEGMNREEAAAVLDAIIFGVYTDDDITINKIGIEAVRFAITALRDPQPDPITGLVPCGCGGRVSIAFYPGWTGTFDLYQVDCFSCHVGTRPCQTAEQAKAAWNAAMGWREEK